MGSALLVLPGCTSDLPAPTNFEVAEPPPPENELELDCAEIPRTANGSLFAYTAGVTGLLEGITYVYSATGLPEGLMLDASTGEISGTVDGDPGDYTIELTIEDEADPDNYSATTECSLTVSPRLSAPLAINDTPCLRNSQSLRSLVVDGTGDGTQIVCDFPGGNGNGRVPAGIEADRENCTLTGTIDETRYGNWTFIMRGTQSGVSVYVPFCVENDVAQGYEIRSSPHDPLEPIVGTFDPNSGFSLGDDMDPRFSILEPTVCGAACFYRYSFLRTNAPIETYTLSPDGLIIDDMMNTQGFFHELRVSGPAVPEEFRDRPWVLSSNVSYCLTGDEGECDDPVEDGDAAYEFGIIMAPSDG
ncbi:MAG: Ig domain-containing protein [Myxococcota bacterium]